MKQTYVKHKSHTDGLPIDVLIIEPDRGAEIKGIVQLVHGMNEYKERYIPFMEFLADNGYLTVIHDHRGHGKSVRSIDDLGYMYEGGYIALIKDTHEITHKIKRYAKDLTGKDLPFILLGHSMGSMVVRCYLRKYDYEIDKLCVLGCPSKMAAMRYGLSRIRWFKLFRGERARLGLAANLVMGVYEIPFARERLQHSWINSDPREVIKYNADPFCNYCFTLNGYENLIRLTVLTYKEGGHKMANPDLPICFFSGADDPCALNSRALNEAMVFLRRQGYSNVSGKMYPGMRHEILNEPRKAEVYEDILRFMEQ